MPRKRRRTSFKAISDTSALFYTPDATTHTRVQNANNIHVQISRSGKPSPPPPQHVYITPSHLRPKPFNIHSPVRENQHHDHDHCESQILDMPDTPPQPSNPPLQHSTSHNPAPTTKRSANPNAPPDLHTTPLGCSLPAQSPPTAFVARNLLEAMNHTITLQRTPEIHVKPVNTEVTPLLLGNSALRSAQKTLGLTPETPSSELRPIDKALEQQLREAQRAVRRLDFFNDATSSRGSCASKEMRPHLTNGEEEHAPGTHTARFTANSSDPSLAPPVLLKPSPPGGDKPAHTHSTPLQSRRLSNISAVTPIPICLETPPNAAEHFELDSNHFTNENSSSVRLPNKNIISEGPARKRMPSPITPLLDAKVRNSLMAGENPRITSPLYNQPKRATSPRVSFHLGNSVETLIPPPNQVCFDAPGKLNDGISSSGTLFKNASGKAVHYPQNAQVNSANSVFSTATGNALPLPSAVKHQIVKHNNSATPGGNSLFRTGKGNPVALPPGGDSRLPKAAVGPPQSLFTTGGGKPVPLPPARQRNDDQPNFALKQPISGNSLFTTGSGKPVAVPSLPENRRQGARAVATSLFTTGRGNPVRLPPRKDAVPQTGRSASLASSFTTGNSVPVSLPRNADAMSSGAGAVPPVSLFTTGKGVPIQIPRADNLKTPNAKASVQTPFTTGKGTPIQFPQPSGVNVPLNSTVLGASLFKTGHGAPIQISHTDSMPNKPNNLTSINTSFNKPSKLNVASSLFKTGSGKKLPITAQLKPGSGHGNIAGENKSLFTTGHGKSVTIPLNRVQSSVGQSALGRTPPHVLANAQSSEHGKAIAISARNQFTPNKRRKTPENLLRRTPNSNNKRNLSKRGGLKTTPFKPPRQITRPRQSNIKTPIKKPARVPVPKTNVPRLLKTGLMACGKPGHTCARDITHIGPIDFPDHEHVGGLKRCHNFKVSREHFGNISCLPDEVLKLLSLQEKNVVGVQDCIDWINKWFPSVSENPASCVGSEAWTRLSYGLAVWKLTRLCLIHGQSSFLSAANIVRELLRRISFEWHKNMQPHLLRMMRRDSAVGSHVVFILVDIEKSDNDRLTLFLSDGWYIARANPDSTLQEQIMRGRIRIGQKVHISGAGLQPTSAYQTFFFGDGDELGSSILTLSANNVWVRRDADNERLGIQRVPLIISSLQRILDDGGICPVARVVVLRSYPTFFMEYLAPTNTEDESTKKCTFLREDAEYEMRAKHQKTIRQKAMTVEDKTDRASWAAESRVTEFPSLPSRDVRSVKEVLVCGTRDDVGSAKARKLVRIYNPSEDLQACLSKEGKEFFMAHLQPRRTAWVGKPEAVRLVKDQKERDNSALLLAFPRKVCSIVDLQCRHVTQGSEFDGVFCILHVTHANDTGDPRFVYFTDDSGSELGILALELSISDNYSLPKVFRRGVGTDYPVVALRDVEFQAFSHEHNLVHARASLRSSFASSRVLGRQKGFEELVAAQKRIESFLRGKEVQLEILKEAVMSFSSGARTSIGAYFTGTQDM